MRRGKKTVPHENHERWLVSYADFITLLFAFFVVMFASSQVNKKKVGNISAYFEAYIRDGTAPAPGALDPSQGAPEPSSGLEALTRAELEKVETQLRQELTAEIGASQMTLSIEPRGLVLSLRESALFPPGRETLGPDSLPMLSKVAAALQKLPDFPVRLEGHTDNIPIETAQFPSNWELSAARAVAVLELLEKRFGISSQRLAAAGYADYHPAADNSQAQGRAHNRRVDIVVLSRSAAEMEPRRRPAEPAPASADASAPAATSAPAGVPPPASASALAATSTSAGARAPAAGRAPMGAPASASAASPPAAAPAPSADARAPAAGRAPLGVPASASAASPPAAAPAQSADARAPAAGRAPLGVPASASAASPPDAAPAPSADARAPAAGRAPMGAPASASAASPPAAAPAQSAGARAPLGVPPSAPAASPPAAAPARPTGARAKDL